MTKFQEQRTFKLAVAVYRIACKEDFSDLKISISREFGKKIRKNNPLSLSSNKIPFNKVKLFLEDFSFLLLLEFIISLEMNIYGNIFLTFHSSEIVSNREAPQCKQR